MKNKFISVLFAASVLTASVPCLAGTIAVTEGTKNIDAVVQSLIDGNTDFNEHIGKVMALQFQSYRVENDSVVFDAYDHQTHELICKIVLLDAPAELKASAKDASAMRYASGTLQSVDASTKSIFIGQIRDFGAL
jgi:hypothetical protein